ncbi:MAG: SDR family oxidoreductase [Candidatus Dormibacteraeota bacterium]|nr:SDR family oxidoreductase [Candidatus Dormibacteraeota bacterium]
MILVVGATGSLGGSIARRLLQEGKPVRLLVRPHSDAKPLINLGAEFVAGDLKDRASLDAAVRGIETVITTANSALRGGEDNPETVEHQGNKNLIDAAVAARVRQFIFVSALGCNPTSPVPFLAGKGKAAVHLRSSGLRHTILEPNLYMDVWLGIVFGMPLAQGRPVTVVGEGRRKHSFIAQDDVRAFAQASIGNPAAIGKTLVLGGPEPMSFREIAAIYETVLGRSLAINYVPAGTPLAGVPEAVSSLATMLDSYDSPIPMDETARRFGVPLTSVESFVRNSVPAGIRP